MGSHFAFFVLFSFVLIMANNIEARKDPGEYWQAVMKDQHMPGAIEGLIHEGSVLPAAFSNKKTKCHTSADEKRNSNDQLENWNAEEQQKPFVKDFEPRPNVSIYHDGTKLTEEKSFVNGFDTTPSTTIYHDDAGLKGEKSFVTEKKSFVNGFDTTPSVTIYHA